MKGCAYRNCFKYKVQRGCPTSGKYWVRQIRQLPRALLENTAYSFILLYMFF